MFEQQGPRGRGGVLRAALAHGVVTVALAIAFTHAPAVQAFEVRPWTSLRSEGVVLQESEMSCGAAAIAMVLGRLYGQHVTEPEVFEVMRGVMRIHGLAATMSEMVKVIELLGYQGRAIAMNMEMLAKLKTPVILFIRPTLSRLEIGHFVVLERVTEDGVVYRDPTFGNRVLDLDTFRGYWETRDDRAFPGRAIAILPRDASQRTQATRYQPLVIEPVAPLRPAF